MKVSRAKIEETGNVSIAFAEINALDVPIAGEREAADPGADPRQWQQAIAVAAYFRAQVRNFEPGHELEDWLDAEAQLKAQAEGLKGFPA